MGIEFERKYRAVPETLDRILAELPGAVQQYEMRTTYYDTPQRDLSARHWTLRLRMENQASVCTLKIPGTDSARFEYALLCPCITDAIPELCKLSGSTELASLAANGLSPICGASFHRTAVTVQLENAVAEVALDRGILLGGGKELPLCEVEVELKDGSQEAVIAFADALALRFGLAPEPQSKFRRAALLGGM